MKAYTSLLESMAGIRDSVRLAVFTRQRADDELPLRSELYGASQMQQHGKVLAKAHTVHTGRVRDRLLARLAENEDVLIDTCSGLIEVIKVGRQVTPAAEWLLDNLYLISEQIRTAKRHLPKVYSKELPQLQKGPSAGLPRVYDIALETISHGDGRVDPESLALFVAAYQSVMPLRLGELWAIPIMLRLALIENLRRVAARLAASNENRNLANAWADQMMESVEKDPGRLILLVADMARSEPPMVSSFVAELERRLQGQSPSLSLPLTWVAHRLSESGQTIEQLVQFETQQQAADQVSISNSIGSLRALGMIDWREFVETMSVVEQTLRADPGASYAAMDFATRDQYRHVVEKMARRNQRAEAEVAARAVHLAQERAQREGSAARAAHVGYFLVGDGRAELEQAVAVRPRRGSAFGRVWRKAPLHLYLGAVLLLTLLFTGAMLAEAYEDGVRTWLLALTAVITLGATSQLAVALVNWFATLIVEPHPLPRMNFSKGIPDSARTLVAVPCMIFDTENIDCLCEAMEVRFLANRDANLRFCLLTDFADAATETTPEDEALLLHARAQIERLNQQYGAQVGDQDRANSGGPFLLLHRPRRWNPQEQAWMGFERKRGKLADLNAFLRAGAQDAFMMIVGATAGLSAIRYVITLDADTQLPRDSARQFVATMAHPLNRPGYDPAMQRVTAGYGILQPRVAASLPADSASRYEHLCGGERGIDPYTRTVSDVYQDVFGEGSFIGKGIYDVDAFEVALSGKLPQNRILSHDLMEGCYARSGLLSDVHLYEDYPGSYCADVKRRHRWMRGDWQLATWLLPRVPAPSGKKGETRPKNPLSALSRWKLFDNLRRSLMAPALALLLILGWTALPAAWFWTLCVLGVVMIPSLCATLVDLLRKPDDVLLRQHLLGAWRAGVRHVAQAALTMTLLAHEAHYSLDAIGRTLWRVLVSHKRLLEWLPSSEAGRMSSCDLKASLRTMWFSPALALVLAIVLLIVRPAALGVAAPILLLWLAAPFAAWWVSLPIARAEPELSRGQSDFLRRIARKSWAFFEVHVGPEDNWLPPDNVQEQPVAVVAHRTSPTNIGLSLLSNLTACDFGYIPVGQLIERTGNTLRTMAALERHQGHFYNWYDTRNLAPLRPMYVSSVDSGNLAGHLLTLRPGLLALIDRPLLEPSLFSGLRDAFLIVRDLSGDSHATELVQFGKLLQQACNQLPANLGEAHVCLKQLRHGAAGFSATLDTAPETPLKWWARALLAQCADACAELVYLAPWCGLPGASECVDLQTIPTLRELARFDPAVADLLAPDAATDAPPAARSGMLSGLQDNNQAQALVQAMHLGARRGAERITALARLAAQAAEFAQIEYDFLYDATTHLLSIGYNVSERRLDASYYDLLASEARLCSFVAIAQGKLPQETWFALGRQLTVAVGEPILVSWSGSMFEYLMPLLVMPTFGNTLLDQTCKAAVQSQIAYGAQRGVPWGISESGYNAFDASLNYQYRAFGVPGLGLKRGLGDDLVIAPYATMMALMVAPEEACDNLQRLAREGFEGRFGFFEAIDFTPSRLPRGQTSAVIRSFMAHHTGMGFLALSYLLLERPMQRRFESDPLFQATMLLLHERVPKATAHYANTPELADIRTTTSEQEMPMRVLNRVDTRMPEVQLLSNGRYHVMVTNAGGSYSRWKDLAVTRWREDSTCDSWGSFCYVRDLADGSFWSTAWQPTLAAPRANSYEVIFSEGRAEFRRHDNGFDMHTEIVVSPEDDIELRRTRIVNRSRSRRTIDVTSYAEVVMAPAAADAAHPAFSNLFVQTEIVHPHSAILCTRRPRSVDEHPPCMFHLMAVHGAAAGKVSYETDRMRFIGRGNSVAAPQAMTGNQPLSGSVGSVLDPVVAIRYQITLAPEQSVVIDMVTGIAETREGALGMIEKYQDRHLADRVFELAWTHSQVVLRQLNASEGDAQLYGRLANSIIYSNAMLRADSGILIKNRRGQSGLWSYAISGDLPIVLVQIKDIANIELVRQMVQAHAYWRLKGLAVDLVIWNEDHASYRQVLQEQIIGLISSGLGAQSIDRPGGIFVRLGEQISSEDRVLFQSVARAILSDSKGTLVEQMNRRGPVEGRVPALTPQRGALVAAEVANPVAAPRGLILSNGLGGFTPDGREYVIVTSPGSVTPAPWINVLANPHFGSVVSESGQAYTWGENAHEFRLTPWNNDPVGDASGEAFYLRDEESGQFWSPTPLPRRGSGTYVTRHGFGYSVFEHEQDGIHSELWVYVALDASVKFSVLKVRNVSGATRKLSATGYVEWVLGDLRPKSIMHIITEADPVTGALFARNSYNTEFPDRIAFFYVDAMTLMMSGDRTEFIGRNGSLQNPAALGRMRLSGKLGAGLDPCAAIQVPFELGEGQEREIVFMLGVAGRRSVDVSTLIQRFRGATEARDALAAVREHWRHTLDAVQVETPEPALNMLANGWLMYQTIACRMWARSGYYQSGGAFGFRDQLQDAMALVHARPDLLRTQLMLCAAHQFVEGDVQHWWHPPTDRGVRTHCSDDYLWLPLATCRYVISTHDTGVLDETVHYLEGRALNPDEDSYYDMPSRSSNTGTLYEHCVRALKRGLRFGVHGLPLIGSCDWNDGMDKVGADGKGESVWLGFFLYDVLMRFAEIARMHDDHAFAVRCQTEAVQLQKNLEMHGWDGEWYRRAYFDDGTPLGSAQNAECQIDSLSQSWSVLSGAGDRERARAAMNQVDRRLVRREVGLVQLLDPPFDKADLNPGYIRGYVPGVRENGGQYTHAAIWTAMAFARLGDNARAWELLRMISPVNHGLSKEQIAIYKVEPYVVAADVYAVPPHTGRGGWTWYTGSSGWMYRLIMESLLGLNLEGERLGITPCMPTEWTSFKMRYRYRSTFFNILVRRLESHEGGGSVLLDGVVQEDETVALTDDGAEHSVEVRLPAVPNGMVIQTDDERR